LGQVIYIRCIVLLCSKNVASHKRQAYQSEAKNFILCLNWAVNTNSLKTNITGIVNAFLAATLEKISFLGESDVVTYSLACLTLAFS